MSTQRFFFFISWVVVIYFLGIDQSHAVPTLNPDVDYTKPNYAYSPAPTVNPTTGAISGGMRKFVDALPGLTSANVNNLGQYIPLAIPDTTCYPGSDYYEIALVEYNEQMHSDLPGPYNPNTPGALGTTLRGYVQLETPANAGFLTRIALKYPDGRPITNAISGAQIYAVDKPHYLGPLIVATRDVPVRLKFVNLLPTGPAGNFFLPIDTTLNGAGPGPNQIGVDAGGAPVYEKYTQNRATVHLHGGYPPWISDGTALQWITPAGETTSYPNGASFQNVPDMPIPLQGSATFYWPNQQSGRLMFYHDHAVGITRMVYAGIAGGYLLVDPTEENMLNAIPNFPGTVPADLAHMIPLVIQDKTYVPDVGTVANTDPLWLDSVKTWQGRTPPGLGDLWFPHVYMPIQDPNSLDGLNPVGRWDYGPWAILPPWPVPPGSVPPTVSTTPEAFMDTAVVNGAAYPHVDVQPTKYRLQILNACNDRFVNLQWYVADPTGYAIDTTGNPVAPGTGFGTEVAMVPAVPDPAIPFPATWLAQTPGAAVPEILDGRAGGVPHPASRGPAMIQISSEGGILPQPVVHSNIPIGYYTNGNTKQHTVFLAPAERADVIVDFSKFAGKTLILYNDSPAPAPGADPRYDFYTTNMDLTAIGGAPATLAGYGPNTRTLLQIRVAPGADSSAPPDDYDPVLLANLQNPTTGLPAIFKRIQDAPIVPQMAYNAIGYTGGAVPPGDNFANFQDTSMTFIPYGTANAITMSMFPKSINELFDPLGRLNSLLGVESAGPNPQPIPLGFTDPPTEVYTNRETQIWKIVHYGVDAHGVHFHLYNVQVINRVGWDGTILPPEPEELGWKDTVRMNPLEDIIVAARMMAPAVPFGCPESSRPLNPSIPLGSSVGFEQVDPVTGNPKAVSNVVANFGWEYTWHCHILGHEENDMMRPTVLSYPAVVPAAPVLSAMQVAGQVHLAWTDGTPVSDPSTMGNPTNEIGFRIERAIGVADVFEQIGTALANATNFTDTTATPNTTTYRYRVTAYNAAGSATSSIVAVGPLTFSSAASARDMNGDKTASLTFTQGALENGYIVVGISMWDAVSGTTIAQVTYGGVPMTLLGTIQNPPIGTAMTEVYLFGLAVGNKAAGNYAVVVTGSTGVDELVFGVTAFSGVNQTVSTGPFASAEGTTANPAVNVVSAAGDMVVDIMGYYQGPASVGAGQTQRWIQEDATDVEDGICSTEPATGPVTTMSYNKTATAWTLGAVALKPVGPPLPDTTPPTIVSATATGPTTVQVLFSEPVTLASAQTVANYSINNNGVPISAAVLGVDTRTVTLTTSTLGGGTYTLTVNNVQDRAVPPNTIAANSTVNFTFTPPLAGITFSSAASARDMDGNNTASLTFTQGALVDGYIVMGISMWDAASGTTIAKVTYGGVPMTLLGTIQNPPIGTTMTEVYLFGLAVGNKAAGNYAVVVTGSTGVDELVFGVTAFSGVNQTVSTGPFASVEGTTANPAVNVVSAAGDMVVDIMGYYQGPASVGAGQTQRWIQQDATDVEDGICSTEPATGPVTTMSYNKTATAWTLGAVALKPVGPPLPDTTPPTIVSATATGPTTVQVLFSEPVTLASAQTVANYSINNNGVPISAAVLGVDTRTVTLTTSTLGGGTYTLTVNNVQDRAVPPNTIAANSTVNFTFTPPLAGITFSSAASARDMNGDKTASLTFTQGALENGYIVVGISMWDAASGTTIAKVTYGGVPMTLLGTIQNPPTGTAMTEVYLFGLAVGNKAAGNYAVVVTGSTGVDELVFGVTAFSGVNQTVSTGPFASAEGTTANPAVNVVSAAGDMVVDIMGYYQGPASVGAGQTQRWVQQDATDVEDGICSTKSATGPATTMSYNKTATAWTLGAVALKPIP